jgi:hypothetical protein
MGGACVHEFYRQDFGASRAGSGKRQLGCSQSKVLGTIKPPAFSPPPATDSPPHWLASQAALFLRAPFESHDAAMGDVLFEIESMSASGIEAVFKEFQHLQLPTRIHENVVAAMHAEEMAFILWQMKNT